MPLWHNRQPNPEMNPAPDKAARDNRKAMKAERTDSKKLDRADDKKARDWVKQQRRKDQ
jgi:hypothetical protein